MNFYSHYHKIRFLRWNESFALLRLNHEKDRHHEVQTEAFELVPLYRQ